MLCDASGRGKSCGIAPLLLARASTRLTSGCGPLTEASSTSPAITYRFRSTPPTRLGRLQRLEALPGFALSYDLIPSKDRELDPQRVVRPSCSLAS